MVRSATHQDLDFLTENEKEIQYDALLESIDKRRIYILEVDNKRVGWLRFNLFWDHIPFLNMLFILQEQRNQGLGSYLLEHWETQMRMLGEATLMTSTLVHEEAIHFYLQYGYKVVGGFHPSQDEYEVILKKDL